MATRVNASLRNGSQKAGIGASGSYRIMKVGIRSGPAVSSVRCIAMA